MAMERLGFKSREIGKIYPELFQIDSAFREVNREISSGHRSFIN